MKGINKKRAENLTQLAFIGLTLFLFWQAFVGFESIRQVSYSEFIDAVRQGQIEVVSIGTVEIRGELRREQNVTSEQSRGLFSRPEVLSAIRPPEVADPELIPLLREKNVKIAGQIETGGWLSEACSHTGPFRSTGDFTRSGFLMRGMRSISSI